MKKKISNLRPKVPKLKVGDFEIRYKQVPYVDRYYFLYCKTYFNGVPAGEQFKIHNNFVKYFGVKNTFYSILCNYDDAWLAKKLEKFEEKVNKLDTWLDNN